MDTITQYKKVCNFMKACGQYVNTLTFDDVNVKTAILRYKLIAEEVGELDDAMKENDHVEMLDALCDILYVVYGAAATYGISTDSFKFQIEPKVPTFRSQAVVKYSDYYNQKRILESALEQYKRGMSFLNYSDLSHSMSYLISTVLGIAELYNYDLIGAFDEVHKSNMSKLCANSEEALKHCESKFAKSTWGGENADKMKQYNPANVVFVDIIDDNNDSYCVIKRKEDGKVLKGPNYFEPSLEQFL